MSGRSIDYRIIDDVLEDGAMSAMLDHEAEVKAKEEAKLSEAKTTSGARIKDEGLGVVHADAPMGNIPMPSGFPAGSLLSGKGTSVQIMAGGRRQQKVMRRTAQQVADELEPKLEKARGKSKAHKRSIRELQVKLAEQKLCIKGQNELIKDQAAEIEELMALATDLSEFGG